MEVLSIPPRAAVPRGIAPAICFKDGKGHVSVNPSYGCGIGCPFCINKADPWHAAGQARSSLPLAGVGEILDELQRRSAQLAGLRLSLLDFCEPFLPSMRRPLRALLAGLDARMPGQAVLLTTRLHPGKPLLDELVGLQNLRLSLFVSLGDATGGVPPVTPVGPRLELLADAAQRGLHAVALLKPLVREWTRPAQLRQLLRCAARSCHEVVLGGLQLSPSIERSLQRAGWPVPSAGAEPHGAVEPELRREVMAMAAALLGDIPASEHRSCAINRHFAMPCLVAGERREAVASEPGELSADRCCADALPAQPLEAQAPPAVRACRWRNGCNLDVADLPAIRACKYYCRGDLQPAAPERASLRDAAGYCRLKAVA